jgi:effector-binding domain-containing protein
LYEEETRLRKVEEWLKRVEKEGSMPDVDVILKKIEAQNVASVRGIIANYGDIGKLYQELFSYLGRKRVKFAGPPMAIYHDGEYKEKDADVEAAVPVAGNLPGTEKVKIRQLPEVTEMACIIHHGPYENFSETYKKLMAWVESNSCQIVGPNREIYVKGPGQFIKGNPANYITEIQLPVRRE